MPKLKNPNKQVKSNTKGLVPCLLAVLGVMMLAGLLFYVTLQSS